MDQLLERCKEKPVTVVFLILYYAVYSLFEYWLGKTNKIKANSTVELVLTVVAAAATLFLRRKDDVSRKKGS